jgi:hypothetical protein
VSPLIFLETSDIGARYCADAACALGYVPLFLCRLATYDADPKRQLTALAHREVDTTRVSSVLEAVRGEPGIGTGALVTLVDSRLAIACEAARALGVRGLDGSVVALKSKAHVARLVPEASPHSVPFRRGGVPHRELEELMRETGRIIVKPDAGAGAAGIFVLDDPKQIATIDARVARAPAHASGAVDYLAQAFLPGALVSLEGFASSGVVHPIGFTDRRKIGATECRAAFPVDDALPARARADAVRTVEALVARSGFRSGYFHAEFLVEDDRASLIDANVGRIGGGPVAELLAFAYDVDPVDVYRHFLEVTLFPDAPATRLYDSAGRRRAASVLYGLEHGGTLVDVELPERTGTRHTQLLGEGAHVTPMGTDDWSWIGILTGLEDDTRRARDALRIRTTRGTERPCF